MTLTRRGKWLIAGGSAVVVAVIVVLAVTGKGSDIIHKLTGSSTCPLTGAEPHGDVPDRPALAVKVENLPEARPQAGLDRADIVYEEPVEGGITRFIVVFQCRDADRVGPIRSARTTDPKVLVQFGEPLFGYAGGVKKVVKLVAQAGLVDVNYAAKESASAYHRDPNRAAPHDLYTSTPGLYKAAGGLSGKPDSLFHYGGDTPKGPPVSVVHTDFSSTANVYWKWKPGWGVWLRYYDGTVKATLEGDAQIRAANVVIQVVKVHTGSIKDVAGTPSPVVKMIGKGKAYVFRDGKMVRGTWERPTLDDTTKFLDSKGHEIALAPGTTWVELLPSDIAVQTSS